MQRKEIKAIIKKYQKLADATHNDDKCYQYVRFAEYLEENIRNFTDDDYETEEDLLNIFNESESDFDDNWNELLPVGIKDILKEEIYFLIANNAKNQLEEVGVRNMVADMLNSDFASIEQIYHFVQELFETDYSPKSIIIPWKVRIVIDNFMNNFRKDLDSYQLFFVPYDEPTTQGWEELHLRCENQNEKKQHDGNIVLEIIFKHSENHIYIPTILFTGIFIFLHQGMREKLLSLIFNVCELSGYRLFIVDMVESFHEKLVKRGATYINYETVEITKFTNLEIQ